jgi:hypothetical protein
MLDSIAATVMICLALVVQALFFALLGMGLIGLTEMAGHKIESDTVLYVILGAAFLVFNAVAFLVYFKQKRANVSVGSTASAFFYIPRAIDTIVYGSQRVSRVEGDSDINPVRDVAQPEAEKDDGE